MASGSSLSQPVTIDPVPNDQKDPKLSLLGQAPDSGVGSPEGSTGVFVALTFAILVSILLMHLRKSVWTMRVFPEQFVSLFTGMLLGILANWTGWLDLSDSILFSFSGVFFNFLLPCIIM